MDGDREGLFSGWESAEAISQDHILSGLVLYCIIVFLHV